MPEFIVPCSWKMQGEYTIEAESWDAAVQAAIDMPSFPRDASYVEGSFRVPRRSPDPHGASGDAGAFHECDNCRGRFREEELAHVWPEIPGALERLDEGGTVPSGECPACGALTYRASAPRRG